MGKRFVGVWHPTDGAVNIDYDPVEEFGHNYAGDLLGVVVNFAEHIEPPIETTGHWFRGGGKPMSRQPRPGGEKVMVTGDRARDRRFTRHNPQILDRPKGQGRLTLMQGLADKQARLDWLLSQPEPRSKQARLARKLEIKRLKMRIKRAQRWLGYGSYRSPMPETVSTKTRDMLSEGLRAERSISRDGDGTLRVERRIVG